MSETDTPTIEDLRAKVFRDRERSGAQAIGGSRRWTMTAGLND